MSNYRIVALYKFVTLTDYKAMREPLLTYCRERKITGTLLLAEEGINGTIAGEMAAMEAVLSYLKSDERLADIDYKESFSDTNPFYRMKVKLKKEIVTLGVPGIDPNKRVGSYVKPEQWSALVRDPSVLVIDTRNDYEVQIGTFDGAVNPNTDSFREFPAFVEKLDKNKHPKVAMFCTGGIRCEKASAYMLEQGFEEVYHLQGGILKYLEEVPEQESVWQGDCFVFDHRVAVNHQLEGGRYSMCYACRRPISDQDKGAEFYQEGVSCHHCHGETSAQDKIRFAQRQRQIDLAKKRHQHHLGITESDVESARQEKAAKKQEAARRARQGQRD